MPLDPAELQEALAVLTSQTPFFDAALAAG
jgi:hypothetical protein